MIVLRGLLLFLMTNLAIASPWMTGPLLAPNGKTIPKHHVNIEPYFFYSLYSGAYRNLEVTPVITAGLTDFMDIQVATPFDANWSNGRQASAIGDASLGLGFQVFRQKEHGVMPNLRVVFQQVFPVGQYELLDPQLFGVDQTGLGSYQTLLAFNFQDLSEIKGGHYLRTRLSLVGASYSSVHVKGVNTFGGNPVTEGNVRLGNGYSADLAFEYTLTQNWVPVVEALYVWSGGVGFIGNPGFTPGGTVDSLAGKGGEQLSLAPALEYNFSPNFGIIGGVWFSASGPPSSQFTSYTLAFNYYF